MKPVLVLYATREGHTRKIADHVATRLRARGMSPDVVDAARLPASLSLGSYCGAIVVASVHRQKHEREMTRFVRRHVSELDHMPSAFLSVSLSEAGAENPTAPSDRRAKAASDAQKMIETFLADTGWRPSRTLAVAGALLYSKYNFFLRFIMKRISAGTGGDTNTSKDYEYTDWNALDRFVDELVSSVLNSQPTPSAH